MTTLWCLKQHSGIIQFERLFHLLLSIFNHPKLLGPWTGNSTNLRIKIERLVLLPIIIEARTNTINKPALCLGTQGLHTDFLPAITEIYNSTARFHQPLEIANCEISILTIPTPEMKPNRTYSHIQMIKSIKSQTDPNHTTTQQNGTTRSHVKSH